MIECDSHEQWFHFGCVNVTADTVPDVFTCCYCV